LWRAETSFDSGEAVTDGFQVRLEVRHVLWVTCQREPVQFALELGAIETGSGENRKHTTVAEEANHIACEIFFTLFGVVQSVRHEQFRELAKRGQVMECNFGHARSIRPASRF
jgi:S-adenosylhomocysteine hydrolase